MTSVFSFIDPVFWLFSLYFIGVVFVAFYLPGKLIISRLKLSVLPETVMSFIIGMVIWTLLAMVLGYVQLRFLIYGYLLLMLFLVLRNKSFTVTRKLPKIRISDPWLLLIFILGFFVQIVTIWFIGFRTNEGYIFCCFWPDSFYHLALIKELVVALPPNEPGVSNTMVQNYHYLANLTVAELVRVFKLPIIATQYQFMPVLVISLFAGIIISIGQKLAINKQFTRWLLFFLFFGGDILFLIILALGKGWHFEATITENATTIWFSPPRVYATVILLSVGYLLLSYVKKPSVFLAVLIGILVGSLVGFKIYLGIFAFCGLGFCSLYLYKSQKLRSFISLAVAILLGLALYLPINSGGGGLFYSGTWRIENFIIRPELNFVRLDALRMMYSSSQNYVKLFLLEGLFFLLYVVSLIGIFFLGFIQSKKSLKEFPPILHIFLLSGLLLSFILGMFFLQETGGANTVQFFFAISLVGSFYAALACSYWLKKRTVVTVIVSVGIIVLASGRVIGETGANLYDLITKHGYYVVLPDEMNALHYLNKHTPESAIILPEQDIAKSDTCYVLAFFSERRMFLCGVGILKDHGMLPAGREEELNTIFTTGTIDAIGDVIRKNNIQYIYATKEFPFTTTEMENHTLSVYENNSRQVLEIKREKLP